MPRLLKFNQNKEASKFTNSRQEPKIVSQRVCANNHNLYGKLTSDTPILDGFGRQITRIAQNGRLQPISSEDTFQEKEKTIIVGNNDKVAREAAILGKPIPKCLK